MPRIPHLIPPRTSGPLTGGSGAAFPSANPFSLFDIALNGIGFEYANSVDNPIIRQTAPFTKDRIDSAKTPGEQTLTNWWITSQETFSGGAGQLNLEPPNETEVSHTRYDLSKNVDVFTPGLIRRLPDTTIVASTTTATQLVALNVAGADAVAYLTSGGAVNLVTGITGGSPTVAAFTAVSAIKSIATDGARVYAADANHVYALNPTSLGTSTTVASFPAAATVGPVLGWAKSRLMAAANGAVYQVDVSTTGVTLGASQLLFTHPTPGWQWRCFGESPTAVLAGGDAGLFSEIVEFSVNEVSGVPQLQISGEAAVLPAGEICLSVNGALSAFLTIGTTRGVRIGSFNTYTGRLEYGPLELLPTDPTIPCNALFSRGTVMYAVGSAYDEGGLIAIDLGTTVDQSGRKAWAPSLISPTTTVNVATSGTVLPVSGRIVFCIPSQGILLEGVGPGVVREAWVRTSRIRFGTTEPKLFKLGSIRGDISNTTVKVSSSTPDVTQPSATISLGTALPPEFALPSNRAEWLQMTFTLNGSNCVLRSYAVKALPGTRRQRLIKLVLSIYDSETTRSGQQTRDHLSARDRRDTLEELDASGDEVLFQEFTPRGVLSTTVVVQQVTFSQYGRPTRTSDVGGNAEVILRTVDS